MLYAQSGTPFGFSQFFQVNSEAVLYIRTRYWLDGLGFEPRWGERVSAPVRTGPEAHPTSCTVGTGSFQGVKRPGPMLNIHPFLALRMRMGCSLSLPTVPA